MARSQGSPRVNLAANTLRIIATSGSLFMDDYSASTALATANSTGLLLAGAVRLGASRYITASTDGVTMTAASGLPSTDQGAAFAMVSNSTGAGMAVNTTGTTWKWLNVTAVQPT